MKRTWMSIVAAGLVLVTLTGASPAKSIGRAQSCAAQCEALCNAARRLVTIGQNEREHSRGACPAPLQERKQDGSCSSSATCAVCGELRENCTCGQSQYGNGNSAGRGHGNGQGKHRGRHCQN